MKDIPPIDNEPFEDFYSTPDYKDKRVLEVGADYGSTASFFKKKGAKMVVSIEADINRYQKLEDNIGNDWSVIALYERIEKPEQLENHIMYYKPDIVHMDCEGCECVLLGLSDECFMLPEWYQIEIHNPGLHQELLDKWDSMGYIILKDDEWTNGVWITVAKRE